MKRAILIIIVIFAINAVCTMSVDAKNVFSTTNVTITKTNTPVLPTIKSTTMADEDSYGTYEKPKNLGTGSPKPKPTPSVKSHLTIIDYKTVSMTSWDPAGDPLEPIEK